jgi:hypothetical protein
MVLHNLKTPIQMAARATAVAMLCAALSIGQSVAAQANDRKGGEIKERIVQVQSKDDVADAGALFTPPKDIAKPIAVIWIHGATVNSILRPTLRSAEALRNEATPSLPVTPGCTISEMWRLGREESESAAARIGESPANRYET